jgi:hypothetical protein
MDTAVREVGLSMMTLLKSKSIEETIKEMGPALVILLTTLVISTFITEFTFNFGLKAIWKTLFRFLRLSLLLTLPLLLLPSVCSGIEGFFNRGKRFLIQAQEDRDTAIHPLKNWVIRPFQGIGLAMLLATKLLMLLEIYTGSKITVETILPQGEFNTRRFFSGIAIGVAVSMLLSLLWALDDLGVRHYNKKSGEIRMIGKYVGLLLPLFFGFYGILSLFQDYSQVLVAKYVGQMIVVLYPPFVIFNVLHSRYLRSREHILLGRLKAFPGFILQGRQEVAASKV